MRPAARPGPTSPTTQNPAPKYSRTFSRKIKIHNDRAFIGPAPVCSQVATTSIVVVPVMNGLTVYQRILIANARTGFWDWECPHYRRKTRGSSAVESDFRCVEHVDAKLVLWDNLALMDQELINRILFG